MTNFEQKLIAFMSLLEIERNSVVGETLNNLGKQEGRRGYNQIGCDSSGHRFVRVYSDTGQKAVCYFVEKATGIIFGAKGWKAYNPVHQYGTLDTTSEWNWSGYYAKSKTGKNSLVPKTERV